MTSLSRVLAIAACAGAAACSPNYVLVPAGGSHVGKAAQRELAMDAVPNAWRDDPIDLDRVATPIWIRLVNRGKGSVRVDFADFALTDPSGERHPALDFYADQPSTSENVLESSTPPASRKELPNWYFDKPGTSEERAQLAPLGDGSGSVELVRQRGRPGGGGLGPDVPRYSGSYYAPHYFGHYSHWPYYYYGSPYYGAYPYYWGERYHLLRVPTADMLRAGLREGVLHAGGTVSGFVYFRYVPTEATNLELSWSPQAANGKPLAILRVALVSTED